MAPVDIEKCFYTNCPATAVAFIIIHPPSTFGNRTRFEARCAYHHATASHAWDSCDFNNYPWTSVPQDVWYVAQVMLS